MAEVTADNLWFLPVAVIFLPLAGKNGLATSFSSDCKSRDTVYRFQVNRFLNTAFYHNMLAVI